MTHLFSLISFFLVQVREAVIVQLGSEEEPLRAVGAVVGSCRKPVLQHVRLQAASRCEHGAADITGEGRTADERVLNEMRLQLQRRVEHSQTQPTLQPRVALRDQMSGNVHLYLLLGLKTHLEIDKIDI